MKSSKSMRVWFALMAILLWIGIFLTGFSNLHWIILVPAIGLTIAATTGVCLSMALINKVFGEKEMS